jgi:ABC-2 type transport system permease protein
MRAGWDVFAQMMLKQWRVLSRYPLNLAAELAVPVVMVLAFTLATLLFAPPGEGAALGGVPVYGFVIYLAFSNALWRIGHSIREEQTQGTLESLYLSPAPRFADLLSRVALMSAWTILGGAAALVVARLIVGRLPLENGWLAAAILALTLSGSVGLGFAFAAYTLLAKESAEMMANLLEFLLLILCAGFYPFSALPRGVLAISRLIPFSYSVDAFRSALLGYPPGFPELLPLGAELGVIVAFAICSPLMGYWLYLHVERKLRREGRLGEY